VNDAWEYLLEEIVFATNYTNGTNKKFLAKLAKDAKEERTPNGHAHASGAHSLTAQVSARSSRVAFGFTHPLRRVGLTLVCALDGRVQPPATAGGSDPGSGACIALLYAGFLQHSAGA
jgi:hypothetical protein